MKFTQYMRPDGRPVPVTVERPQAIETEARRLVEAGVRFDIEVLMTGEVSMTAEIDDDAGETNVLAMEVVQNGPPVLDAADRLVTSAARQPSSAARGETL